MGFRAGLAAALSVALAAGPVLAAAPSRDQYQSFALYGYVRGWTTTTAPLAPWEAALETALKAGTPDQAARRLAPLYGLDPRDMRELIDIWVLASADIDEMSPAGQEARIGELERRAMALVRATRHADLPLQAAAAVHNLRGDCRTPALTALTVGAADPVAAAWQVASATDCTAMYEAFARRAPDKAAAALFVLAQDNRLATPDRLPLLAWLVSEEGLSHVAPGDRDEVGGRLNRRYIALLFEAGLASRGLAVDARLSPAMSAIVHGGERPALSARIDGTVVSLARVAPEDFGPQDLAAALLVTGDEAGARRLLPALNTPAARAQLACAYQTGGPGERTGCGRDELPFKTLYLDHLLNRPGDDPYPLAEAAVGAGFRFSGPPRGVWADVFCRVFAEPQYRDCTAARQATASAAAGFFGPYGDDEAKEARQARAAVAAIAPPAYGPLQAQTAADLAEVVRLNGGEPPAEPAHTRRNDDPSPSRFAERPLPPGGGGGQTALRLASLTPLPNGYRLVRIGRDGARIAAITVSQNYDPTGEVSSGGYWVHLSDDGGRTWRAPLYTGLADHFPYVVKTRSSLPLIAGGVINLAVDVRQIDTRSITYPPVGMQLKRSADNLYLTIPLADLARDSDGDGLTDLAEEHLLLRPAVADRLDKPLRAGGRPMPPCTDPGDPGVQALGRLLEKLFSVHTGALIQDPAPASGRSADAALAAAIGGPGAATSPDRPILLLGDAADFACLRVDRLAIIYGPDDLEALRSLSPDFRAISIGPVYYNRAHDRAFVSWSAGWTGGTVRLLLKDGAWILEDLVSWIT